MSRKEETGQQIKQNRRENKVRILSQRIAKQLTGYLALNMVFRKSVMNILPLSLSIILD